jgi:endonuclease/exonuclease/phosphatase family metal-dependent hydrolase
MTWNIHGGIGLDGRFELGRITDTITRINPAIVALQEVDSRRRLSNGRSAFEVLREALGGYGIEAKSIATADGDYGQMLIGRCPFDGTTVHDISHADREPRRAIETELRLPEGVVRIVATHFGLSLSERREQARNLVEIARRHSATTIMLGDFNDWFWPGSLWKAFKHELPGRTPHATFPSWCPLFRLDRIFCWPRNALLASFVERSARIASDHLPVVADIAVGIVEKATSVPHKA